MKKLLMLLAAGATIICGAAALSACGGGTEYSVKCEPCENGYVIVSDTNAKAGDKIILAAHPDAGYRITSFMLDGEEIEGVSFVMPEKDVAVSARFEAVTYSVTYVLGDATVTGTNPESYTVESAAELIAPEKEGYEICGWYTYCTEPMYGYEGDIEAFRVTSLEGLFGNLTLYAKYYNDWHELVISDDSENGWCFVEDSIGKAQCGDTVEVTVVPDTGYEFDYLTVNGERVEGTAFTMPADDAEIVAYFKPIRYAITYELDGGINSPDNPEFYTGKDDSITLSDATKEGYIFDGWYYVDAYGNEWLVYDSVYYVYEPSDVTFYAHFIEEEEESDWE